MLPVSSISVISNYIEHVCVIFNVGSLVIISLLLILLFYLIDLSKTSLIKYYADVVGLFPYNWDHVWGIKKFIFPVGIRL